MNQLHGMTTETRNPTTMNLDSMTVLEIVSAMNREDAAVPVAVCKALPQIATAAEWAAEAFGRGGRLFYMGAGTSGRLGVLDASECPPTFGVPPEQVVGLIAGGDAALRSAIEGAEDNADQGRRDLQQRDLTAADMVVGIAASGRTPYVLGGLAYAASLGCHTVSITCNAGSQMANAAQLAIELVVGPEVLTGSTRLKSGTAQKMVLNMISTASMVATGKAYQNLMVDVQKTNQKLEARAVNIVSEATGASDDTAGKTLRQASGNVKLAVTMILCGCDREEAARRLELAGGHVRKAIG